MKLNRAYPELLISDLGVRFHAGFANVENNEAIQAMKAMDGFGFVIEENTPAEDAALKRKSRKSQQ